MTDRATVDWTGPLWTYYDLKVNRINLGPKGFYALIAAWKDKQGKISNECELLYIGYSFPPEPLRKRILAPHASYRFVNSFMKDNPQMTLFVNIGYLTQLTLQRETKKFYEDVECCLILRNQPESNTQCKDSYPLSRRPIIVNNTGDYWPLKTRSQCFSQ